MKYLMRQSRDGRVELIDLAPPRPDGAPLARLFGAFRWRTALVWYMRTLAWVWLFKGLFDWAIILGATQRFGALDGAPAAMQATIVAFACFDLLAAVGLWLAAPWGGAIWLLCAGVEAASPVVSPHAAAIGYSEALLNVVLLIGYFALSWRAVRERD